MGKQKIILGGFFIVLVVGVWMIFQLPLSKRIEKQPEPLAISKPDTQQIEKYREISKELKEEDEVSYFEDIFDWGDMTEEEINRQAVVDWIAMGMLYEGEDRGELLDISLLALRSRGPDALPEIDQALSAMSGVVGAHRPKTFLMYALGELGRDFSGGTAPEYKKGREMIQQLIQRELDQKPQMLSEEEAQKVDPYYQPDIKMIDGKAYHTNAMTQMSAVQALAKIGDDDAKKTMHILVSNDSQESSVRKMATHLLFQVSPEDFEEISEDEAVSLDPGLVAKSEEEEIPTQNTE